MKSLAELDRLVTDVIAQEDFRVEDLVGFSARRENERLDNDGSTAPPAAVLESGVIPAGNPISPQLAHDGWISASVKIKLPAHKNEVDEVHAPEFEVPNVIYRPLLDVIKEKFEGPDFEQLHLTPFSHMWDPGHRNNNNHTPSQSSPGENNPGPSNLASPTPETNPQHETLYGEIYTSPEMMEAHKALPPDPLYQVVVAALMFWSDSTHLANFGTAALWPLYTFFGNQSKYTRAKPTSNAAHHQAYFPSLPDNIEEIYRQFFGKPPPAYVLTHLKRELMHAIWDLLLSVDFIHAYVHGVLIKCHDGITRRIFPRFFTYSADYPEK